MNYFTSFHTHYTKMELDSKIDTMSYIDGCLLILGHGFKLGCIKVNLKVKKMEPNTEEGGTQDVECV